jgi:hypothetical protein
MTTTMNGSNATVDRFRDDIIDWYQDGMTIQEIIQRLKTRQNLTVTRRTLERRLKTWKIKKNIRISSDIKDLLILRIAFHYHQNLNDQEIQWALIHEGFEKIPVHTLARLRLELKLKRRNTVQETKQAREELRKHVQLELDKGVIENYGRGALHVHFRKMGINASK